MKKVTLFICTVVCIMSMQSVIGKENEIMKKHKTFVLVHGAWQGAFVWDRVRDDLEKNGNTVIVVELLGHGKDNTPPIKASIEAYSNQVVLAIKDVKEKVILVGHSMAGLVISATAEKIPTKIESLVYLGAFLPNDGESLMSLTMQDKQSLLGPAIIPSADQLTLDIKKDAIISIFCQDATDKTQKLVLSHFKVEPAIPFGDKVSLSQANFGSVTKFYIHTLLDHAVGIDLQNKMTAASVVKKEYSISSGHSPHITNPHAVSKILLEIAEYK